MKRTLRIQSLKIAIVRDGFPNNVEVTSDPVAPTLIRIFSIDTLTDEEETACRAAFKNAQRRLGKADR